MVTRQREKISAALFIIGFLLVLGTFGDADFYGNWLDEYYIRAGFGTGLMLGALPVSKLRQKKSRR